MRDGFTHARESPSGYDPQKYVIHADEREVTSSLVMRNPAVVWYGLMSNSTRQILIFLTHYLYSVFLLLCLIILCAYVVAVTVAGSTDFVFQLTISNIG